MASIMDGDQSGDEGSREPAPTLSSCELLLRVWLWPLAVEESSNYSEKFIIDLLDVLFRASADR